MTSTTIDSIDIRQKIGASISYEQYFNLVEKVVSEEKTTGPVQTEALAHYTMLNLRRMKRTEKTIKMSPELESAIKAIDRPQTWLVLTEAWCGDAAAFTPVINKLATLNPNIRLGFLLRDEHLDLMDQYLTNGGRSIPKLIMLDEHNHEIGTWGPRPAPLAELRLEWINDPEIEAGRVKELIQLWYAKDKGQTTMKELADLLS
jgi:hypothetical protein